MYSDLISPVLWHFWDQSERQLLIPWKDAEL